MQNIARSGAAINAPTALRVSGKAPRALSAKQVELLPLAPLFEACKKKGLMVSDINREVRIYQVNRYCALMPFDFIESFKDLVCEPAQILILVDAIESGVLSW